MTQGECARVLLDAVSLFFFKESAISVIFGVSERKDGAPQTQCQVGPLKFLESDIFQFCVGGFAPRCFLFG